MNIQIQNIRPSFYPSASLAAVSNTDTAPHRSRLAAAFTAVVTSFVSDILLPILSLLPFIDRNFDEKFAVLKAGPRYGEGSARGYNTMKLALEDGAVIMSWG